MIIGQGHENELMTMNGAQHPKEMLVDLMFPERKPGDL